MQIFIEPSDVLLFRDGRPFSAGEGHRARSIFPPTPNTMQGVIRSRVLAERCGRYRQYRDRCLNCPDQNNCTIPEEIGLPANLVTNEDGHFGKMHLKGPLIANNGLTNNDQQLFYFPMPADVVQVKDKGSSVTPQLRILQPLSTQLPGQNDGHHQLLPLWAAATKPVESVQGYLDQHQLQQYLLRSCPQTVTKTDLLFAKESRFGIEVNYSRQTVKESQLYQTEFVRCESNVGLYIEIEGIRQFSADPDEKSGLMAIGGENRASSYTQLDTGIDWDKLREQFRENLPKTAGFKLYLATPTIFKQGWLPSWVNAETLEGEYNGVLIKLKAAAIGRYQIIGGWDVAHNRPKPTRRAVSAGSVYYFTTEAEPAKILDTFHWQNLADDASDAQIGYGLSLVGLWQYQ
jgi:CRISPR-associated protein Cmr3